MQFKIWLENENSLGGGIPELQAPLDDSTPASDEVKRTGLQPQVDSSQIHTRQKDRTNSIQNVDDVIQQADRQFPEEDFKPIKKFKKMWDQLKRKWDKIKNEPEPVQKNVPGLGGESGNKDYISMMQQHPNMVVTGDTQGPHGTGIFGTM